MESTKPVLRVDVDDGIIPVPVYNKAGQEIGVFMFNPTDVGIVNRFNEFADGFDAVVEPLMQVNINSDGTTDEDDAGAVSALNEATTRLYAACDKLFGGNYSEAFFGTVNPFSPVNGRFYCENAIEAIGSFIAKQFDKETKKISSRVDKYTHGYTARTGKHKDGKK